MERIMRVLVVFLLVCGVLSGCYQNNTHDQCDFSDEGIADAQMETFLNALESSDSEQILSLFSKNALLETGELQKSVNILYSYYQGNYISYNNWSATGSSTTREGGHVVKEIYGTYDVTTNEGIHRFAFLYVAVDNFDPDNIGLMSVYVIKMDDDTDPQYAYRGDGLYTPGIHIGIPNNLPEELKCRIQ